MKINIYDNSDKPQYNPNTMKNVGVGGTQTIIIELAKELQSRGHDVTVYIRCNFPDIYDGVKYMQYYDYKPEGEDVLIGFESFPKASDTKKLINWSTRIAVKDITRYPDVDHIVVLSDWHRDRYASELPKEFMQKMVVIEPGVREEFFKETQKWDYSISYAGHPFKGGMKSLIEFARRLKPKMRHAQIHVHGGGGLWGWDDDQYRTLYDDLIKNKILFHGQGGKKRMLKQLGGSQIFLYPVGKHIQEPFSLMVLEAMASGCVVIASDNGYIKNIVGDTGYIIGGNIDDYKWHLTAMEIILELFNDHDTLEELSKDSRNKVREYTWAKTAENLENLL
jgi:glycosyltransferase involved in cell wall biosynthesis